MEKEDERRISFENSISTMEADIKKAQLVSSIIEKAEQGDEEENMGRS
ncbi:MAG: hypothetical protein PHS15_06730 [Clostridiaceae bacterium]|nr:hypothetical protein [Clostridiaceae bacterium]